MENKNYELVEYYEEEGRQSLFYPFSNWEIIMDVMIVIVILGAFLLYVYH